jgi:signal transduction histidine kinase
MSAVASVIEFPVRHEYYRQLEDDDIVLELATADDLETAGARLVEWIRRASGAGGVEWWVTRDDGALELVTATGPAFGSHHELPLGHSGRLVLHGGRLDPEIESVLASLLPILRRRVADERLLQTTIDLARRNETLEEYAALVAHELKAPLQAALVADDPLGPVEDALDLVEALLESAQNEPGETTFSSTVEALDEAVKDLGAELEITTDLVTRLPLPPKPLRVILRNLLSNAVKAGAQHVHVTVVQSSRSSCLLVDDDGVGLAESDRYAAGSGLGLSLCRRIAARFGGVLELAPRPSGGTRATLELPERSR